MADREFLPELIGLLAVDPDLGAVCQFLAVNWPTTSTMHQVVILEVGQDASMQLQGWFGVPSHIIPNVQRFSMWDALPAALAVREERMVALAAAQEVDSAFPNLAALGLNIGGLLAAPIMAIGRAIGACVLVSHDPLSDAEADQRALDQACLALGIFLVGRHRERGHESSEAVLGNGATAPNGQHRPDVPSALTERQVTVLQHLAERQTNRQIAARLGFSESTIRQETMAIYRFLGVEGRRQAVDFARARGLLG